MNIPEPTPMYAVKRPPDKKPDDSSVIITFDRTCKCSIIELMFCLECNYTGHFVYMRDNILSVAHCKNCNGTGELHLNKDCFYYNQER